MHKNHLERRGFRPNEKALAKLSKVITLMNGTKTVAPIVIGRRARKEWTCAAEDCDLPPIVWDEVYVQMSIGLAAYNSDYSRYHMACALRRELIEQVDVDSTNQRRQAIMMVRAKRKSG